MFTTDCAHTHFYNTRKENPNRLSGVLRQRGCSQSTAIFFVLNGGVRPINVRDQSGIWVEFGGKAVDHGNLGEFGWNLGDLLEFGAIWGIWRYLEEFWGFFGKLGKIVGNLAKLCFPTFSQISPNSAPISPNFATFHQNSLNLAQIGQNCTKYPQIPLFPQIPPNSPKFQTFSPNSSIFPQIAHFRARSTPDQ